MTNFAPCEYWFNLCNAKWIAYTSFSIVGHLQCVLLNICVKIVNKRPLIGYICICHLPQHHYVRFVPIHVSLASVYNVYVCLDLDKPTIEQPRDYHSSTEKPDLAL